MPEEELLALPLLPYIHMPLVVGPGIIQDMPVVENGRVVAAKTMNVNMAFDHRFMDGMHASRVFSEIRTMLENPFESFDRISAVASARIAPVRAGGPRS